jgi:nicotinate-nucleotide pyrophosphorylase (carboxylating)
MQLNISSLDKFFYQALQEDIGICGDITTDSIVSKEKLVQFEVIAKQDLVLCGGEIAEWYFDYFKIHNYKSYVDDGSSLEKNSIIFSGVANARAILYAERVILNFLQHLSGVATLTNKFVEEVKGTKAKISDTRKTIPGLRMLQKYAVRSGGGVNHRLALDSCILIKDNHIVACEGITKAYNLALKNKPHYTKIIVECDTLDQYKECLDLGVEIIMLDNMTPEQVYECVRLNKGRAFIEVSGGIRADNVREYALAGVDLISVGKLTHSAPSVDIGMDFLSL